MEVQQIILSPRRLCPEELNPYINRVKSHPKVLRDFAQVPQLYRQRNTVLELGCGNGHFLQSYLNKHPGLFGLGIDLRYKRVYRTLTKIEKLNGYAARWDVMGFVQRSPGNLWNEVWIQFPDPWPKSRHAKHRMLSIKLFYGIYRLLKEGGRFCFLSDCSRYWEFLLEINQRTKLFPISKSCIGDLYSDEPGSLFKEIFKKNGDCLYSIEFQKPSFSLNSKSFP